MNSIHRTLFDFDEPPIVETALGVEFAPLENWGTPHFGLFWHEIKAQYPRFEVRSPLVSLNDGDLEYSEIPVRCWFYDEPQTKLIQVQHDRFIYNWRNYFSKTRYPRYEDSKRIFQSEWMKFCSFLQVNQFEMPKVRRCELIYVNHIEKGKGWESFADLPNVINYFSDLSSNNLLPIPEIVVLNMVYQVPDIKGRLNVQLQPAIRQEDGKEILQLQLTATGQPASSETYDIIKWFDIARQCINNGFVDFTSEKMHEIWGKKERK